MINEYYCIIPKLEYYTCIFYLLIHADNIYEAKDFINNMIIKLAVLTYFLNAYRNYKP